MGKINAARASYFEAHKDKKEFWFTQHEDGTLKAHLTENGAVNECSVIKRNLNQDVTPVHVTREEYDAWVEAGKPETEKESESGGVPVKSAKEQLDEAQKAYDAALASGNAEDIASTKKALSTAKARVTREENKQS